MSTTIEVRGKTPGERLAEMRVGRSVTVRSLGRICGISPSNISKMERDQLGITIDNATKLANALNCKRDLFLPDDAE